ncbi:MAG: CDP-diacylglycerol--serine O-phosphatidyltransferase [Proteobacteria bacterium]|nr:CDP-diacylglycerol--serine O-phosphatidyltransferase [Pseudomonadota bacterium]
MSRRDGVRPPAGQRAPRRRRRRGRGQSGRGFSQLLPHLLTTGNLAAGFYAIVKASEGNFERAAVAIIVAAVFDGFDGRVARRVGATSRFGTEYDSIADTVSFGVAPAFLAFQAGHFAELGWTGWVMAFMFTACAALRLARFNVSPGRYAGRFEGLASPAAAGVVLSTVLFATFLNENDLSLGLPAALPAAGLALVSILMVSPIPYHSFKGVEFRASYRSVVIVVVGFAIILLKPAVTLFVIALLYAASGPIAAIYRWRTGRTLDELLLTTESEAAGDDSQGTTA